MPLVEHSAFGAAPVRYDLTALPDDPDEQVEATITLMRRYILEDSTSLEIQADVAEANRLYPTLAPHERIFRFIKERVKFNDDQQTASPVSAQEGGIQIVETLIRPRDLSRMARDGGTKLGDCDDFSMYGLSMLIGAGLPTGQAKLVTVAANEQVPHQFSHVYGAMYGSDGTRVPMDFSHGPYPGWETANRYRIQEWSVTDGLGILIAAGLAAWTLYRYSRKN